MKRSKISLVAACVAGVMLLSAAVWAYPAFMKTFMDTYKIDKNSTLGKARCGICHKVNNTGYDFGPQLTEIGSKLPKEALLDAIVHPSAGISFGYEGWEISMKDGSKLSGIIARKTVTDIEIKFPGGSHKEIKTEDVLTLTQMKESMMTKGLYDNMSRQDLASLLEFLSQLKKK